MRPTIAAANELSAIRGHLVMQVAGDGPAEGVLQPSAIRYTSQGQVPVGGDVVLAIDGRELLTTEDLWRYLALETSPGDTVEFTLLRAGQRRTVSLTLGTRPS